MIELENRQLIIYIRISYRLVGYKKRILFTGDLLYDQMPIYAFYPSTNPVDLVTSLEKVSNINGVKKVFAHIIRSG